MGIGLCSNDIIVDVVVAAVVRMIIVNVIVATARIIIAIIGVITTLTAIPAFSISRSKMSTGGVSMTSGDHKSSWH